MGVADALNGENNRPDYIEEDDWYDILAKAHSAIILCLGDKVLREVARETSAAGVWLKLDSLYMTKSLANRLYLKKKLYSLKMDPGMSVDDHSDEFNKIIIGLENIDVTVEDEDQAILFLSSLPSNYEHFLETLMYGRESLSMEEVMAALNTRELKKKHEEKDDGAEGLFARGKGDQKSAYKKGNQRPKFKGKKVFKCFVCGSEKHFKRDCPEWKKRKGNDYRNHNRRQGSNHGDHEESSEGYESSDVLMVISDESKDGWVMDSGGSYHMTPHKEYFQDLKEEDLGTVKLGDHRPCQVAGHGSVVLKLQNGSRFTLENVRYIPSLKRNLLSLGTLERDGFNVSLKEGKARVIKGSMIVLTGTRKQNNIYILNGNVEKSDVVLITEEGNKQALLWHKRLGHISSQGLIELNKKKVLGNLVSCEVQFCEHCIMGKHKKVKFNQGKHTTKGILDYIHSDLWGPARTESMGGARYFLSLIDDYSRRVWVFMLKHKNEAFARFKEWRILVENQTERKIKKLRTDNGLEFCNSEFNDFCKKHGIGRHLTIPGTPQQNGLAERMNRTLLERLRCMLDGAGMPKKFWAEAVSTTAFLINRSPSRVIENKTPMEIWVGTQPSYQDLRVFGSFCYAHISQGKLEPRAVKCIFLGYSENVKGYRVWRMDESRPKVFVSRNVVFQEHILYGQVLGSNKGKEVLPEVESFDAQLNETESCSTSNAKQESELEPLSYSDAISSVERVKWIKAMEEEMESLEKNDTWDIVDLPAGQKPVACKWLYKIKEGVNTDDPPRYKARLVAKGFTQQAGIDYKEVYSPVVKHSSIRIILSLTAKSLYGLKQSPRQWYKRFDEFVVSNGFTRSEYDSCVYFREYNSQDYLYLFLYVDDMLLACKEQEEINATKRMLMQEFDMKELGKAKKILGMEIKRDMENSYMSKAPYANAVGSLMYLLVCTRPDLRYAVSLVSRYISNPERMHWAAVKWILRYIAGTNSKGLLFGSTGGAASQVEGFVDSDFAKDLDKGRSLTGYMFKVEDSLVSWKAQLQPVVALSTTEAEYIALTEAMKEALWLKRFVSELGIHLLKTVVHCDSQGAVLLSKNVVFHDKTKHILVKLFWIREVISSNEVTVEKIGTQDNPADMFTKVLPGPKFKFCVDSAVVL
ncbi:hypothetical protein SSX86_016773 [Deinandra increscens subsp. villosa]|uniref:Retrovirus-related Pol polyprotein from transposon TNT 1-94 n=1 Tax=Deinandra increscens subsp. villosa TaxID=3103831 RepID=A0AAP0D3D5_9ASTR